MTLLSSWHKHSPLVLGQEYQTITVISCMFYADARGLTVEFCMLQPFVLCSIAAHPDIKTFCNRNPWLPVFCIGGDTLTEVMPVIYIRDQCARSHPQSRKKCQKESRDKALRKNLPTYLDLLPGH